MNYHRAGRAECARAPGSASNGFFIIGLIPASWKLPGRLSGPEPRAEPGRSNRCAITFILGEDGCVGGVSGGSCRRIFGSVSNSDEEALEYCYAAKILANNAVEARRVEPSGD